MSGIEKFEELKVWQKSRALATHVYAITKTEELSKDFGLKDQIRRSAVSVSSNIAEGFGRGGNKEFIQFLSIAKGSLYELKSQLYIATDLGYCSEMQVQGINGLMEEIGKMINSLINYLKSSERKGSKFSEPIENYTAQPQTKTKNQQLRTKNQQLKTNN